MSKIERVRDAMTNPPEERYREEKTAAGWRLSAIEWERELGEGDEARPYSEEVPYGLRVGEDCRKLVDEAEEMRVLALMMDLIGDDQPMSRVAEELNTRGHSRRDGRAWTKALVFQMLSRLIEVGPRVFSTTQWRKRKRRLPRAV